MKKEFILNEIWMLTINAAFQRANIYANEPSEEVKRFFKSNLREYLTDSIIPYYENDDNVWDSTHIENINQISKFTLKYEDILQDGKLNFGVCQKLLNLYLKYLWCIDEVKTPPHFPIDRTIQQKLGINNLISWTKNMGEDEYRLIIDFAKEMLPVYKVERLAELELKLYNRRNY